ncbi:MAG TPA: glycosyltransferase family 2 protein [Chryseosolibacter sp.]|nr:glycosyltransferase family 2 protein [Chryseosolibacter sp.]
MNESLTILVPVYNEENCIRPLTALMDEFLMEPGLDTTVLFVNDGSSDNSASLIEDVCRSDQRYSYLMLGKNYGLSTALKAGIDNCHSTFIGYIDADLQTHPSDFRKLLPFAQHYDLVTGYRLERKDTVTKRLSSVLANSFKRWLLGSDIIDTGCPLKIIRTRVAQQMPFFNGMHRFMPDLVLLLGGVVKQVPIRHYPRFSGKSKYGLKNRSLGPLADAIAFRWMQKKFIRYTVRSASLAYGNEIMATGNK